MITRDDLRGFVVTRLRPRAQRLHARLGMGLSVAAYHAALLRQVDATARDVLADAVAKRTRVVTTGPTAMERLGTFVAAHAAELDRLARACAPDVSDDVVGETYLKLTTSFRAHPDRDHLAFLRLHGGAQRSPDRAQGRGSPGGADACRDRTWPARRPAAVLPVPQRRQPPIEAGTVIRA